MKECFGLEIILQNEVDSVVGWHYISRRLKEEVLSYAVRRLAALSSAGQAFLSADAGGARWLFENWIA